MNIYSLYEIYRSHCDEALDTMSSKLLNKTIKYLLPRGLLHIDGNLR